MSLSISQASQRALHLKLTPPPFQPVNSVSGGNEMGGWSLLLSLNSANSQNNKDRDYVHPQAKRCAAKLTAESLAMCTESLGSETGSEIGDDISMLSLQNTENFHPPIRYSDYVIKKQSRSDVNFPPPLTSAIGVRVRPRREGGRLVLEAIRVSASDPNFRAERSNGRLRLHLMSDQETEHDVEEDEECLGRGIEGNCDNFRGKIGIERPKTRCKIWETHYGCLLKPICLP